jgi:ankyrin repeat protein
MYKNTIFLNDINDAIINNKHSLLRNLIVGFKNTNILNTTNKNGETFLWLASRHGFEKCLSILLEFGANPNIKTLFYEETPVYVACKYGHTNCLKLLIKYKADLCLGNALGEQPIHVAAYYGNLDCIKLLHKEGNIYLDEQDSEGRTAAYICTYNNHYKCLEYFIENNCDIDIVDNKGISILYVASTENNLLCLKLLIDCGADVNLKDNLGRTPLNATLDENIKKILRKNGATWR